MPRSFVGRCPKRPSIGNGDGCQANRGPPANGDQTATPVLADDDDMAALNKRFKDYWASFSFVGLVVATVFLSASVTPSLLPRHFLTQGLLSGFAVAIGYGVGIALTYFYHFLQFREPQGKTRSISQWIAAGAAAIVFIASIWQMTAWQNSIRQLMEMPLVETAYPYRTAGIAIAFAALLIGVTRLLIRCTSFVSSKVERFVPPRVARSIGFTLVVLVVLLLGNDLVVARLLHSADRAFLNLDKIVDDGVEPPALPGVTGSSESLVDWDLIGRQGKLFLTEGPTQEEISSFWGGEAMRPIRVFVGMRARPTARDRAKLALSELQRVGGFERSKLIVATPTGTGWLDPSAVDTIEFVHRGDTAIVSTQYSYLPSWMTILVDPHKSPESAVALFQEVYEYWKTLPKDSRPELYVHGLSLGSLGSEMSADLFTIFEDPIDGAVWSGPPFPSRRWRQVVENRNPGSPAWLPEFRDSRMVRFTSQTNHLDDHNQWGPIRCVYVQYASDPMVWFSEDLAWRRPDWLREERGPDVSPGLRWTPIVTFLQIGFDLPMATSVPLGYGHNYSPDSYIYAWVSVTRPTDWSDKLSEKLKARFEQRAVPKP